MFLWEIHPALVHFPIALLLSAVALDLVSYVRPKDFLPRVAAGLYVAGVVGGACAGVAGMFAYLNAPMQSDPGILIHLHPIAALATMILFTGLAVIRWRTRTIPPAPSIAFLSLIGAAMLMGTGWLGSHLVYHHGVGVMPEAHRHEQEKPELERTPVQDVLRRQ